MKVHEVKYINEDCAIMKLSIGFLEWNYTHTSKDGFREGSMTYKSEIPKQGELWVND